MIKLDYMTGRCAYPLHEPDSDDLSALSDVEVGAYLAAIISDISERGFFAGWMTDVELCAWGWACSKAQRNTAFGMTTVEAVEIARLRRIHARLGGQWVAALGGGVPHDRKKRVSKKGKALEEGVYLLSAEEWTAHLKKRDALDDVPDELIFTRPIVLSPEGAHQILDLVDHPPEPSPALQRAIAAGRAAVK